jgi:hypothetical protein
VDLLGNSVEGDLKPVFLQVLRAMLLLQRDRESMHLESSQAKLVMGSLVDQFGSDGHTQRKTKLLYILTWSFSS